MAIITISRGSMRLGQELAEKVAGMLGCPCIGRELVAEAAQKLGVAKEIVDRKMESVPSVWERLTSDRKVYVMAMQAALSDHLLKGDFVYHSWAGHMLLRDLLVLRVRVIAPINMRITSAMEQEDIPRERAIAHIHKVDEDRTRWTRFIYGIDWTDPALYDIVLNLGVMTMDTACESVAAMAKRPEFSLQPLRDRLPDFALAAKVRMALAAHPSTKALDLEVKAEKGVVSASGTVELASLSTAIDRSLERELRSVITSVPGVKDLMLEIRTSYALPVD
jgi:cytidylate kinase